MVANSALRTTILAEIDGKVHLQLGLQVFKELHSGRLT